MFLKILCVVFNLFTLLLHADSIFTPTDTTKVQRIDFRDAILLVCRKNYIVDTNQAKENESLLAILPGIGYSQLTRFTFGIAVNASFYITKSKHANISTINFFPEYSQNKQFTSMLVSNIWTKNNRYNILTDWRYYNYSVKDFGLGNYSIESVFNEYTYQFIRLHQTILKKVFSDFFIGPGYSFDYHYKIKNTDAALKPIVANSNITKSTISSGISLNVLYDTRRNENSPIANGWYTNLLCIQNLKALKSTSNYKTIYLDVRHYISFPRRTKGILAFWNLNWFTLGSNAPYFDLPSTLWDTYDNAGRTFIQGRFRGAKMIYFETEYRFNLLESELLGAGIFVNIQSFSQSNKSDFSKILPGYGGSLRLKLNKKSNVYFVVSYGIGIGGSKGFLFNFGEMF